MCSQPIVKPLKHLRFYCNGGSGKIPIMEKQNLLDVCVQRTSLTEKFVKHASRLVEDVETLSLDPDIYIAAVQSELGRAGVVNKNRRIYQVQEFVEQNERLQERLGAGEFVDGELGHPESGSTFDVAARLVSVDTVVDNNTAMAEGVFAILNTAAGRDLLTLYRAGMDVGASSRGTGLVEKIVLDEGSQYLEANPGFMGRTVQLVHEFDLETYDLVRVPSAGTFIKRERQDESEETLEAVKELEMSDQNTEIVEETPAAATIVKAESDPLESLNESQREVLLKIVEAVSFDDTEAVTESKLAEQVSALREQMDVSRARTSLSEAETQGLKEQVSTLNEEVQALREEKEARVMADAVAISVEEAVDGKRFSGLVRKELNTLVESGLIDGPESVPAHAARLFSMIEEANTPLAAPVVQEVVDAADDLVTESASADLKTDAPITNDINEQLLALINKNRA